MAAPTPFFDEFVNLAVVGGGFLRTPFLHATNPLPDEPGQPGACPVAEPQIIALPAARRTSTLSMHDAPFRRIVMSSALVRRVTHDQAAIANQEGAGVAFRFHEGPHRNLARAFVNSSTRFFDAAALILDKHPGADALIDPKDANDLGITDPTLMPTGFLAVVTRSWQDLRHVDPSSTMAHRIPLQMDVDFDVVFLAGMGVNTPFMIPILGNQGDVRVWDARLGPDSYDAMGSPVQGGGALQILEDDAGGLYLSGSATASPLDQLPIVLMDEAGQVFARDVVFQDAYPTPTGMVLPAARIGTPYLAHLPAPSANFSYVSSVLPPGLTFDLGSNAISGTPLAYGGNYRVTAKALTLDGSTSDVTFYLAVNRYPRELLRLVGVEGNDNATGEYLALQFMPYGSILTYDGHAYEFRRSRSPTEPWPTCRQVPWVYGHSNRRGGREAQAVWDLTGAVDGSP